MEGEQDDDVVVHLNMNHPLNKYMNEQTEGMDDTQFKSFMFRVSRKIAVEFGLRTIGNISRFRRRQAVRALVRSFRDGYHAGHVNGYRLGSEDAENGIGP